MIDNIDINDLSLSFIRGNIIYVSQNETLFQTTIKGNLDLINNSKEKQSLCCKTTLLDKTFNTDNYLNIFLEENGNNISTGQRKKIIIARALLRAKDFLILDESFNEISIEEERKILNNIFNNYPYLTVILISHRQDNSDLFDKIYKIKRRSINE
jgi:ABC-type bacteriocin/lantibiotic exporter with double-glycine peptidase domain